MTIRVLLRYPAGRGDDQRPPGRLRQRVIAVLNRASRDGAEITVSGIARAAAVDRTFLYRHRDLLGKIHALEATTPPATGDTTGPAVTRASLQADLLAAHERARQTARARAGRQGCPDQRIRGGAPPRKAHQAYRSHLAMSTIPEQPRPGVSPARRSISQAPRDQAVIPRE